MSDAPRKPGLTLRKVGLYALLLLIVVCVGLFLIGRHQMGKAGEIRRDAELKLTRATQYIAQQAVDDANEAMAQAGASNWSIANDAMDDVIKELAAMEGIAPRSLRADMKDVKRKALLAQNAVAERSDQAPAAIAAFRQALQKITERPLTP